MPPTTPTPLLHCPTCSPPIPFADECQLEAHYLAEHYNFRPYSCCYGCGGEGGKFPTEAVLRQHYTTVHGSEPDKENHRDIAHFPVHNLIKAKVRAHVDTAVEAARQVGKNHSGNVKVPLLTRSDTNTSKNGEAANHGKKLQKATSSRRQSAGRSGSASKGVNNIQQQPVAAATRLQSRARAISDQLTSTSQHTSPVSTLRKSVWNHPSKWIKCSGCYEKRFRRHNNKARLIEHINKVHCQLPTFECLKCLEKFTDTADQRPAIDHVRLEHFNGRRVFPVTALKEHLQDNLVVVEKQLESALKLYFPDADTWIGTC